ncbi:MAG TPA: histidinol-phosphate transaminase, partial [Xanthomonadaceae bacterium]|nr:histidinol-phosphate transaminase [Xanthomonadaceae bacterium]
MSAIDLVRESLRGFDGYRSARREATGGEVLLNANESPWPPVGDPGLGLNRYPDPQPPALRAALARLYGVDEAGVLVTRGSDEGIDLLVRALCRPGRDAVLVCPPTFGMYAVSARVQEAPLIEAALAQTDEGFAVAPERVIAAALAGAARLVFLCSPNNPTGASIRPGEIARIARALRESAVVAVDEAYVEFSGTAPATGLLPVHGNLVVLRTLSKAHALAGARVGALLGPPALVAVLRAIMAPYPLAAPCVAAALRATCEDALEATRRRVATLLGERERLASALRALPGVQRVYASDANFLLVRMAGAAAVRERAAAAGVLVRDVSHQPGLEDCLRISIGTPQE